MTVDVKYVYVAGPMRKGDWTQNVRAGLFAASQLMKLDLVPFLPHLSWFHDLVAPQEFEDWLAYDFAWIERCDALLRLKGESEGADREVEHAMRLGKPVHEGTAGSFIASLRLMPPSPWFVRHCHLCGKEKASVTAQDAERLLAFHYDRRHQNWTHEQRAEVSA